VKRIALCVLLVAGCATLSQQSAARKALMDKATFDLACARDEIKVLRVVDDKVLVDVGSGLPVTRGGYLARGCGNDARYIVDCSGDEKSPQCTAQQTNDLSAAIPSSAR
jgi:hypothetical protein